MADDQIEYTGGQVQIANGDLQHAGAAKFTLKNNAKMVHTLRRSGAGYVVGNREATGTIESFIPPDGPERDYVQQCIDGKAIQIRYKPPGATFVFQGVFDQVDLDMTNGEAVKITTNVLGMISKV